MDNKKLIEILNRLYLTFDEKDIEDYQKLLFVIYNSMFLDDDVPQSVKYKIFSLLELVINKFSNDEPEEYDCYDQNKDYYNDGKVNIREIEAREGRRIRGMDDLYIRDTLHTDQYNDIGFKDLFEKFVSYRLRQNTIFKNAH